MGSLRKQLQERVSQTKQRPAASERAVPEHRPGSRARATVAQQGLWVANELSGNVAYTVPVLHVIEGPLDVDVLDGALVTMLERHVALRTTFRDSTGELTQVLEPTPTTVLTRRSLLDSKSELREVQAERLIVAEIATTFDLTQQIPFRATLITLDPQLHKLLLTIHHIACDQWSMGIFATELDEVYGSRLQGREPDLRPLDTDYLSLGARQAIRSSSEGVDHFVERARGKPALRFVADKPRPARSSYTGDECAIWLGQKRTLQIQNCARKLGASPFLVTLAAFLALARTHSGDPDFVFGTSSAGRESEDVAGLVGFFVNTLVLATSVKGEETFADLVTHAKEILGDAQEYTDTPFDEVVKRLGVSGDGTGNSLTAVLFQQDNTPDSAFRFEGCRTDIDDDVNSHASKYELLVSVRNQADDTRIHIQYDCDLFTSGRIEALLATMDHFLQRACDDPSRPVKNLPVVSQAEGKLLAAVNATGTEWDGPATLHGLVLAQARSTPDAPAILLPSGGQMSYRRLVDESTKAAAALAALGLGPGDTVIVALPPGSAYMVACLATLCTGAAFVPLAPDTPDERREQVRAKASPAMELCTVADVEKLVDAGVGRSFSPQEVAPDSRAYVIFTSGSTGEPKGVQVRHCGIVNNLKDLAQRLELTGNDRCLAVSSTGFDMSIFEGFGILGSGGATVILDPDYRLDPSHWLDRAEAAGVTVWNSVPSLLGLFLDEMEQEAGCHVPLRAAVLGGDWVPLSMPARWWNACPDATFDVLGGATEASIHSTHTRVSHVDPSWSSIPYGRPMANQKTVVVDEFDRTCPVGVPGRLLLGGVGLADGYLGSAEQTAALFTTRSDGEQWYDTGDVARWTSDLTLELLGRRDFLIKLNGLRIEPGDVEAALLRGGQVSAAVVLVLADPEQRLVAVVESEQKPDVLAMRQKLSVELPSYMVPVAYHWVQAMPLNSSGKLDRRQVRHAVVADTQLNIASQNLPLATFRERHVAEVWAAVLGVEVTSAADDFFALGGDSFKAVKAARLVDPALPTVALFRHPTVRELADHLDQEGPSDQQRRLVRLSGPAVDPTVRIVCIPYGGGNAIAYQPLADHLGEVVEVLSVNLPGHDLSDNSALQPISDVAAQVAAELGALPELPTAVYAQCAGCATADRLARAMRHKGVRLDAVFVGAALPDRDPQASMALMRDSDDALLLGHMRGLGGFDGVLDDSDITRILRVVRHDLQEMVRMYLNEADLPPEPLQVPVHCVVGGADPATEGYEDRYLDWARLGDPVSLSVLPTGDHYFCTTDPAGLAFHIRSRLGLSPAQAQGK